MEKVLESIKKGIIVSCQALEDEPLFGEGIMAKMALAAYKGGANAIRANSVRDIKQIKEVVNLPLIGIIKRDYDNSDIYITPTMKEVDEVVAAGAEIVALDGTERQRPDGKTIKELIAEIKIKYPKTLIMADISTEEEGVNAEKYGADIISTTLSGYTPYSPKLKGPDFDLIQKLCAKVNIPVIAEGRICYPEEAKKALDLGAFTVVVGGAITRPMEITRRFSSYIK